MRLEWIEPARIDAEWPSILPALAPSIALDTQRTPETALDDVRAGKLVAWRVSDGASGAILGSIGQTTDGRRAIWVVHLGGQMAGGPRAKARQVRHFMHHFECFGRELGCDEIRIEGRVSQWGKILPDYQRDGVVLRKELE